MKINSELLYEELVAAGLPVISINEDGGIYCRTLDASEQITAAAVLAAHDPAKMSIEQTSQRARTDFRMLPNWASWTPVEARDYVVSNILTGQTASQVSDWIENNISTLANAKTALKMLAVAVVTLRDIVSLIAMAVLYLRDISVRKL